MAGQISPTRSAMLASKASLKTAQSGADLLKRKRDALIGEFFALVKDALAAREELASVSTGAYTSLFGAKAWDTPEAVESLSLAGSGDYAIDMQIDNLYGVKVPRIAVPQRDTATTFSPINVGARTIQAATDFGGVMDGIVKVAATETKLRRIGEEIKKTSRRVNALEQVLIPGIQDDIRFIRSVLDQREREASFTLKKIKAKLEADAKKDKENMQAGNHGSAAD
ncbi:ATP synthase subunit D [Deinococcus radiopugnans]|uniref:V-type ATP synthase subunit D n=2 Tax=Deinococcus radiopugnans TaxID=57497 RepID=A0A0A7KCY0_9DEIO|nr:V-type ATP synthase subunit D [Deinococcus radiopugnans]AIZ43955.1 ATP synthase subunit D [Deinococcus radiopugnans]MBB6017221.1 V/A-type H+-transporting ATPase subunit D [Deinococcus radiopugnans ATCC 19172]QLG09435.1 V-type ATP synthase subunit D [Deinococcus sp. D7000]TNM70535.1 V-type ATP synthase subunit D [Deinococcus radiopugnans ATCC 19172]